MRIEHMALRISKLDMCADMCVDMCVDMYVQALALGVKRMSCTSILMRAERCVYRHACGRVDGYGPRAFQAKSRRHLRVRGHGPTRMSEHAGLYIGIADGISGYFLTGLGRELSKMP